MGKGFILEKIIGLGTASFGIKRYGPISHKDAEEVLETYMYNDGHLIDTARTYGDSESIIGNFLHNKREPLVLCTKTEGVKVIKDCETSLKKLQTDYIDIYYLHSVDFITKRMIDDMHKLKNNGKIINIGLSVKNSIIPFLPYVNGFDVIQIPFNMNYVANEILFGRFNGKIIARSIFDRGVLKNKIKEAMKFVCSFPNINSILIGPKNKEQVCELMNLNC